MPHCRDDAKADQHRGCHEGTHAAQIVHPLAHAESTDVQKDCEPKQAEADQEKEEPVLGESGSVFSPRECPNSGQIEKQRGDEEHVGEPVAPAAHEPVKIPEHLLASKGRDRLPPGNDVTTR